MPAAVDKLAAQRVGNEIYLTVTIPTQNIDATTPADVSRIDIFAATSATPPPRTRIFEIASKVASIEVQPAARPGQDGATPAGSQPSPLPAQGATVTVREALTQADLIPKELPAATTRNPVPIAAATPASPFPHRYYIAVAMSDRGRAGPPGTLLDVPLPPVPDPPATVTSTYDADKVTLSWEPAGGVVGFLLENPVPIEPAPVDEPSEAAPRPATPALPTGPIAYNVYRDFPAETSSAPVETAVGYVPPAPLNSAPISGFTYNDSQQMDFGRQRCYTVRAVRGTPPNVVLGAPSERHCMTPEDRYPPAAPTALNSIAADGVISLLWEPNGEADLAGYLILRGRPGDATLQPLTPTPVKDVRYEDRDVMPGVRYVYAVQAVDTHQPMANVSDESNRVEETAR